ncbi:MAG: LLM class flavin-dependent oxidoreductase [Anaerolineales bacterium]|nr:LLM class flavin-dependent oxidoreductase [Chloroflexota bacterium]MBL6982835.1 LLM class flavin-dependent oxidoreductase [Anaerolineales bacterium]
MAEDAGWDGFFLWDHIARGVAPQNDPWAAMAAIACNTEKMRLGLMVTPLSRRRPWKVARELVTLDHLSKGRMIFGVGLGDFKGKEFEGFGEISDPVTRGIMLDEGLEFINGLQSGEKFKRSRNLKEYLTPDEIREITAYIGEHRANKNTFDVCMSGILPTKYLGNDHAIVQAYIVAGTTWWIEFVYSATRSLAHNTKRIQFGPPR